MDLDDDDDGDNDGDDISLDAEGDVQAMGDAAITAADGDHLTTERPDKKSLQDSGRVNDVNEHMRGQQGAKAGGRQGDGASGSGQDRVDDVMLSPDSSPAAAAGALLNHCLPGALNGHPQLQLFAQDVCVWQL